MITTYRSTFLFLIIVQICYFGPVLFKGEVVFPHNNDREVLGFKSDDGHISNRKFSDQSSVYIPKINHHLNGNSHAWISTWNPYVQLGRPTGQLNGFGKAYLITHLLSLFTDDPFVLYTILTTLTVFLTGIFLFLFLKALHLHPLACCISAIGLSTGVFFSYWLTFVMFLSTHCWTLCLLWLITKFINKKSYVVAAGITFAIYSLLMTGRLQATILQIYVISAYTLIYLWRSDSKAKVKLCTALMLISSAVFGLIMASPALIDMIIRARLSVRMSAGDEFFVDVLPKVQSFKDLGIFLSTLFDSFWIGKPIKQDYPVVFNGFSLTPLYFGLFVLSFFNGQWRRLWFWQLLCLVCLIATIWPSAYLFMVRYMGFCLSRNQPLGGAIIAAFILCGYAVDYIMRNKPNKNTPSLIQLVVLILPLLLMGISGLLWWNIQKLNLIYVMLCCGIVAGLLWFVMSRKPLLLLTLAVTTVFAYGFNLMLTRPQERIQTTSALVRKIQAEISDGSRYAKVGRELARVFVSNQETLLKIKSIHSYDSLSSRNYQRLVLQLSEKGTQTYGRYFNYITSDSKLADAAFSYTGVGLLLSLTESRLELHKTSLPPILYAQTKNFDQKDDNQIILDGFLNEHSELKVEQITSFDDFKRFRVTPSDQKTILFVSQQYHPQWKASSKGSPLEIVIINDFYQGVVIPPNTHEVQLQFRPYVLWSWLPQLLYVLFGLGLLANWMQKRWQDNK